MNKTRKIGDILESVSVTHKFDKSELIFLNTSDVLEGKILINNYVKVSTLKGQAKKTIKNGDILFSEIRPKNKRYAHVNVSNPEDYVVSTKLMVLRNKSKDVLTDYVYYFLTYDGTLDYLQMRAENRIGSFPQITFDTVKVLELTIPDIDEQKRIAAILSTLDSKIDLNNRINDELEAMAKTLYDYWFVQFDFPDAKGKPYKTSGGKMVWSQELKKEIPIGWNAGELNDIANITMGQSPPGESYNEERKGTIFYQGCTDFGLRYPSVRQYTAAPTRFAKEGDILLSVRAPVGTLNIANTDCCIGRGLAALNSKANANTFLFGVMRNLKQVFDRRNVDGTTFGSITKDDLFSLKVLIPDSDLLTAYEKAMRPAFEKQNMIELESRQLSELRDWLLPMLMNGQVKVQSAKEGKFLSDAERLVHQSIAKSQGKLVDFTPVHGITRPDNNLKHAILVLLTKQKLGINYGEVALQKTVFNIAAFNPSSVEMEYGFVNFNYGTYCSQLTDDLKANPYLAKEVIKGNNEVYALATRFEQEVNNALLLPEYAAYVKAVNKTLAIYKDPFIGKKTDKIELLNTVAKLIMDWQTDNPDKIYAEMGKWTIEQTGYNTKADKFTKADTAKMIRLIKDKGLVDVLLNN